MMNEGFINSLKQYLQEELPGPDAHSKLAPFNRGVKNLQIEPGPKVREGSVLILLYPVFEEIYLPLMQRPDYQGIHSGQISFPGGKKEENDEDLIATALRENMEEIGILEKDVNVLGTLSELYIPASNFKVLPVVGYLKSQPYFVPDQYEVAKIIETSIKELLNEANIKQGLIKTSSGAEIVAPYFNIQGHVVWGATAMMLSEFLAVVRKIGIDEGGGKNLKSI